MMATDMCYLAAVLVVCTFVQAKAETIQVLKFVVAQVATQLPHASRIVRLAGAYFKHHASNNLLPPFQPHPCVCKNSRVRVKLFARPMQL